MITCNILLLLVSNTTFTHDLAHHKNISKCVHSQNHFQNLCTTFCTLLSYFRETWGNLKWVLMIMSNCSFTHVWSAAVHSTAFGHLNSFVVYKHVLKWKAMQNPSRFLTSLQTPDTFCLDLKPCRHHSQFRCVPSMWGVSWLMLINLSACLRTWPHFNGKRVILLKEAGSCNSLQVCNLKSKKTKDSTFGSSSGYHYLWFGLIVILCFHSCSL